jgi:hypothetical protein
MAVTLDDQLADQMVEMSDCYWVAWLGKRLVVWMAAWMVALMVFQRGGLLVCMKAVSMADL